MSDGRPSGHYGQHLAAFTWYTNCRPQAQRARRPPIHYACAAVISGSTKVLAREETMLVQACPHGPRPAASRPPPTDPNRPRSASAPACQRAVAGRGRHAAAPGRPRIRLCMQQAAPLGERILAEGRDGQVDRERRGHAARRRGPRHSPVPGSTAPSPQPHRECPPRRRVQRAPGAASRGGRADIGVAQPFSPPAHPL